MDIFFRNLVVFEESHDMFIRSFVDASFVPVIELSVVARLRAVGGVADPDPVLAADAPFETRGTWVGGIGRVLACIGNLGAIREPVSRGRHCKK